MGPMLAAGLQFSRALPHPHGTAFDGLIPKPLHTFGNLSNAASRQTVGISQHQRHPLSYGLLDSAVVEHQAEVVDRQIQGLCGGTIDLRGHLQIVWRVRHVHDDTWATLFTQVINPYSEAGFESIEFVSKRLHSALLSHGSFHQGVECAAQMLAMNGLRTSPGMNRRPGTPVSTNNSSSSTLRPLR